MNISQMGKELSASETGIERRRKTEYQKLEHYHGKISAVVSRKESYINELNGDERGGNDKQKDSRPVYVFNFHL